MLGDSDESGFSECSYLSGEDAPLPKRVKVENVDLGGAAVEFTKLASVPLINEEYSIAPDMMFGWRPKNMGVGSPIPLNFAMEEAPVCENLSTGAEFLTIYHGYRPKDSLVMHKAFSGANSYPFHFSATYQGVSAGKQDTKDFVGMHPHHRDNLVFDSRFESGNLDRVVKVKSDEYDLYMRTDANTRGHNQWFFFKVNNQQAQTVKFTLVNFTKHDSLYSQGMQPCVYSKKACDSGLSRGWHRAGEHVNYSYSKISRFGARRRNYWQMSFTYFFQHDDDEVHFAYSIPYTFSRLTALINDFKLNVSDHIIKCDFLCKSLSGVDVPLLSISEFPILMPKRHIVITCRVHPGETHSSWMLEGLLKYLVSSEVCARQLRARFVFYVVPMLNPDGVILGNYRSCFAGNDLNRQWMSPEPRLHSTIHSLKELLTKTQSNGGLFTFIDLHAHSRKKNVFIYGPHYPLHDEKYYRMRVLPKLLSERTEMFRYFGCKFRNDESKKKAARLVVWREHKLPYSYTLEASFHGYLTPQRTTVPFDEELLMKMGSLICDGLLDYVLLLEEEQTRKERKRLARLRKKKRKGADSESSDDEPNKRTLRNVLNSIRQEAVMEHDSDSGGSDSDPSQDELTEQEQITLHCQINKAIDDFAEFGNQPARKASVPRQRNKKTADCSFEARSSLSKYFSRASQKDPRERKKSLNPKSAVDSTPLHSAIYLHSADRKKPLASSQNARRLSTYRPAKELTRIPAQDKSEGPRKSIYTRASLDPLIPAKPSSKGFSEIAKRLNDMLKQRSRSSSSDNSPQFSTVREVQTRRRYAESPDSPSLNSLLQIIPARPQTRDYRRQGHTSSQLRMYGRRSKPIYNSDLLDL
jgi:hypothetical protein